MAAALWIPLEIVIVPVNRLQGSESRGGCSPERGETHAIWAEPGFQQTKEAGFLLIRTIGQLAEKCKRLTQANAILEKRVRDLEEKNR